MCDLRLQRERLSVTMAESNARGGRGEVSDERSANAIDRQIGERVRARRLEVGMSQERLAELMGVTFQQVQKYEKGVNRIAASRLFAIALALDMPVAAFFDRLKGAKGGPPADFAAALTTPGAHELVRTYAGIKSPKVRRRILEVVKAVDEDEA
jgi:transcriptional regulator with XRE-family HTH domain